MNGVDADARTAVANLIVCWMITVRRFDGGMLSNLEEKALSRAAAATWYLESLLDVPLFAHVDISVNATFELLLGLEKSLGQD